MTTFDAICKILIRDYAAAAESLTPQTTLESLAIDSLGVIELIFEIEDVFEVSVPDDNPNMAHEFGTLAELSQFVDQLIAAKQKSAAAKPTALAAGADVSTPS